MYSHNKMEIKEYPVGTIFGEKEVEAVQRVLNSGDPLTRGPDVDLFEKEFAQYCNAKHAVAVSSCGAALKITSKILTCFGIFFTCASVKGDKFSLPKKPRDVQLTTISILPRTLSTFTQSIQSIWIDFEKLFPCPNLPTIVKFLPEEKNTDTAFATPPVPSISTDFPLILPNSDS